MIRNKRAAAWLGLFACLCGPPARADLYEATAAAAKQDFARAFELYQPLAELGLANAQENLAVMYVNGEGVKRDNVLGYAWATLALKNGGGDAAKSIVAQIEPHLSATARARIAEVHARFGNEALQARLLPDAGPPEVETNSTPCRMKAAPDPDHYFPAKAKIQGITGEVLMDVRVAADGSVRLPRAWYSFPAEIFEEAGRAVALNSSYTPKVVDGVFMPCTIRFKVKFEIGESGRSRPPAEALRIVKDLRKKAHAGDPISQLVYGLASSLRKEFRTEEDANTNWFLKSAQAGIPAAQFLVGMQLMALDSQGGSRAKGIRWLEMSANGGSGAAMTALASYLLGPGQDSASREQGFEWLQRAAATSHREGKYLFAALLASWPDPARRDPARALALADEVGKAFDYDPLYYEIRAAALAGDGNFAEAKRAQSRALNMARKLGWDTELHQARLQAYESGKLLDKELVSF